MVGCTRSLYSLAARGEGPNPKKFAQVDETTNMTANSSGVGCFCAGSGYCTSTGPTSPRPPGSAR